MPTAEIRTARGAATPAPFPDAESTPISSGKTNAVENTGPMNPTDWAMQSHRESFAAPSRS